MGLFNENENDKQYRDLIKIIRSSSLDYECIDYLVSYVNGIREGRKANDFFDFDFLKDIMIRIISMEFDDLDHLKDYFNNLIVFVEFLLPEGKESEDYDALKSFIFTNFTGNYNLINENIFSEELYSLINNSRDFTQIMTIIINDENLVNNFDSIVEFATTMGKEIDDRELLKREIISYLHLYGSILSDDEEYLEKRVNETRMRYGVYPGIDERTLANISREVEKARGLLKKLDTLEKRVDSYLLRVDEKTKIGIQELNATINGGKKELSEYSSSAIKRMQEDLSASKQELLDELNRYIVSLETTLKSNSDQIFNQLLIDSREKLEQIRVIAGGLSGNVTKELLKIQGETQKSLDTLKNYVESNPELHSSLKIASESEDVMKALLEFNARNKQAEELIASGAILTQPGTTELVVPNEDFLVPNFEMTPGILPAFDRSVAFNKRMKALEAKIKELEKNGYIIPDALKEALPWYLMGKKIVYFYGPTQSGKTTIADLLVKVVETELLDGGKITEEHSITSYNDVRGVFDENALFYALYYGKTIFYDELDNGNPDNLIVLGTYASKLVNKIDHPDRDIKVQFAKRRFVPINPNARIISAGNTAGKGRNREYTARSKMDESSQERLIPIYVDYNSKVEAKIFGKYSEFYDFFNFFRKACNDWAVDSSKDACEGNVTTGDASTIVECMNEDSMDISSLLKGIFIQTKDDDYLAYLVKAAKSVYGVDSINDEELLNMNNIPIKKLSSSDIASCFVTLCESKLNKNKRVRRK